MAFIAKYAKFVMVLLSAIATTVTTQFPATDHIITIIVGFVGAVLVLLVPNSGSKSAELKAEE
jgi:uncharacterized membrane protein YeaQ/YmgE (transglycosylase-associated protein family)